MQRNNEINVRNGNAFVSYLLDLFLRNASKFFLSLYIQNMYSSAIFNLTQINMIPYDTIGTRNFLEKKYDSILLLIPIKYIKYILVSRTWSL